MPARAVLAIIALLAITLALALPSSAVADGGQGSAWAITIQPVEPEVGQTVHVNARALGQGGIPKYVFHLGEQDPPAFRLDSETSMSADFLNQPVSWQLTALRLGQQTFTISVTYEKQVCPESEAAGCTFEFVEDESPEITLIVPSAAGDTSCDGEVSSEDAMVVLQIVAGLLDKPFCAIFADPNGDDAWTTVDALLILQLVAGLIPEFPAE